MRSSPLLLLAGQALAYSKQASSSLPQLAVNINQTNNYINHLGGCGYHNTTAAISSGATLTSGSACQSADNAISSQLTNISSGIQGALNLFKSSRPSNEIGSSQIVSDFNLFATSYYALFNAMDLAECQYILTPTSRSFAVQFTGIGSVTALKDGWNSIVGELSRDFSIATQIAGANFKQQTHFGGTSFLATQVAGPQPVALAGCMLITSIVESEGGGSS